MSQDLRFSLTRNGEPIHWMSIGTKPVRFEKAIEVNELQQFGFEVESREPDTEYGVWIGDVEAGRATRRDQRPASTVGTPRGQFVLWDDAYYFEGARGTVWIHLFSWQVDTDERHERGKLPVIVTSGKLSESRYATMLEQLSSLAAGLVLDLVSKTLKSLRLTINPSDLQIRTSAVELRLLESTWPVIAANLVSIAQEPACRLRRTLITKNCWGSERLDGRSVTALTRTGIDPRHPAATLPFRAPIQRIEESADTIEHRIIRGFVELIYQRARECKTNLTRHIASIQQDRVWRDRLLSPADSLYSLEDEPRLTRLREGLRRTDSLLHDVEFCRQMEPIARVRPMLSLESTPIFSNVERYRRIRQEMIRFLRAGLVVIEEGSDERLKSTSRLYEQWVFLQIVAAFRQSGLVCAGQQGLLHTTQKFRFTLDLDRGARVTFLLGEGRALVIRYEPWVMPRSQAHQNRESIYRGRAGEAAWSPDVLIEFLSKMESAGEPAHVEYAVVMDAKYTQRIQEHHWSDTAKYLEIRATADNEQVVKQQWLVYPGGDEPPTEEIEFRDQALRWTDNGPNCPRADTITGTLALSPPSTSDSLSVAQGWIVQPQGSALTFARGLLRYMGHEDSPQMPLTRSLSGIHD